MTRSGSAAYETGAHHQTGVGDTRHPDLVGRDFTATGPNQLWVCFIIDAYARIIVRWRVAAHRRTPMALDAIEMAR